MEYFNAGELHEAFVEWLLKRGDHVVSCVQDRTVHDQTVEELVTARPGPTPWPSER